MGSRAGTLKGKPENLVKLYESMEKKVKAWGGVEIVMRGRYALLRTTRIFADVVFMRDALRIAILLDRKVEDPLFFKVGAMSPHRVAHVAKAHDAAELRAVMPYLKEAWRFAMTDRGTARRRAVR